jgi:hypothetical protein
MDRLEVAKRLVTAVRDSYVSEGKVCDCCGMITFVDWNAKQLREQLNGVLIRLENIQKRIKNTKGKTKRP